MGQDLIHCGQVGLVLSVINDRAATVPDPNAPLFDRFSLVKGDGDSYRCLAATGAVGIDHHRACLGFAYGWIRRIVVVESKHRHRRAEITGIVLGPHPEVVNGIGLTNELGRDRTADKGIIAWVVVAIGGPTIVVTGQTAAAVAPGAPLEVTPVTDILMLTTADSRAIQGGRRWIGVCLGRYYPP